MPWSSTGATTGSIGSGLALVAAEIGVCIVPAAARLRLDLVYCLMDGERATSPIMLNHCINEGTCYIAAIN